MGTVNPMERYCSVCDAVCQDKEVTIGSIRDFREALVLLSTSLLCDMMMKMD